MKRFWISAALLLVTAAPAVSELFPECVLDPKMVTPERPLCCLNPPTFNTDDKTKPFAWDIPADALLTSQPEVNCFAWQEFIALNWPASPGRRGAPDTSAPLDKWGHPDARGPVVWETYKVNTDLFLPAGAIPAPWNTHPPVPPECGGDGTAADGHVKQLRQRSKVRQDSGHEQVLESVDEAGVAPPAWLTAQNRNQVHFEVLVNQDYFRYVVDAANRFYDSRRQADAVKLGGGGISLPVGPSRYGKTGAMEFKAGWLEIDPELRDRFLTAEAWIVQSDSDGDGDPPSCRQALVGLVGLHIVHKTKSMPNWTWATFEHVDNAPDRVQVAKGEAGDRPYTFYDPNCSPEDCPPNRKPEYGDDPTKPIQVVRDTPIPPYVQALNDAVHAMIPEHSVFRNYHLVNTQWPQAGEEVAPGETKPLQEGGPAPTTGLANVSSETYVQHKTCLTCHRNATIACSSISGPGPVAASDYTFQLGKASEPNRPAFCGPQDDD